MRVDHFAYDLPPGIIAEEPLADREAARLLSVEGERLVHETVRNLDRLVTPGTLVVVNDTRVIPARILGEKKGTGGKTEIFLVRKQPLGDCADAVEKWSALGRASKGLKAGAEIIAGKLVVRVLEVLGDGLLGVELRTTDGSSIEAARNEVGHVPLPPYIKREDRTEDRARYQTVFAKEDGAVAAPTAGLHLTNALLDRLRERQCEVESITLHVGLGTFQPVTVDDFDEHPMHSEVFSVSRQLASSVARARERGKPVLAIGTTVVRALETSADPKRYGLVEPMSGETRILIQPGYEFRVVDQLLTNFHLPKSTLLALVCAFAGTQRVLSAYREAIATGYRFFSYGDAMLLRRADS